MEGSEKMMNKAKEEKRVEELPDSEMENVTGGDNSKPLRCCRRCGRLTDGVIAVSSGGHRTEYLCYECYQKVGAASRQIFR